MLHLDRTEIRRTDGLQGMLTVTTSGPGFRMDTGDPLTASIVEPGTRHVVATVAGQGGIAGVGRDLTPANHIGVLVGTARCDGGIGSAVPPGSYGVVVRITAEGSGDKRAFLSEEAPLTVRP